MKSAENENLSVKETVVTIFIGGMLAFGIALVFDIYVWPGHFLGWLGLP